MTTSSEGSPINRTPQTNIGLKWLSFGRNLMGWLPEMQQHVEHDAWIWMCSYSCRQNRTQTRLCVSICFHTIILGFSSQSWAKTSHQDLEKLKYLLRCNNWQHDPLSAAGYRGPTEPRAPENAIAARYDLHPWPKVGCVSRLDPLKLGYWMIWVSLKRQTSI